MPKWFKDPPRERRGPYNQLKLTGDDLLELHELREAGEPIERLARRFGVPKSTIHRYVKNKTLERPSAGNKPALQYFGEELVVEWILKHESIGMCVPVNAMTAMAQRVAIKLDRPWFKGNRGWLAGFMNRHSNIAKRMAEATEHSRLQAIHPVVVSDFFDKLEALVKNRPAHLIWNVDETGTDLMNVQTGKVLATRGSKNVVTPRSPHRDRFSFVIFASASGGSISPPVLLPGSKMTPSLANCAAAWPEATTMPVECGTQTEESFVECIKYSVRRRPRAVCCC